MQRAFLLAVSLIWLAGCQLLPNQKADKHLYGAPQQLYALNMEHPLFRGKLTIEEACDSHNISTTFWDEENQFFRIDVLAAEGNPSLNSPPFISDAALLQLALDTYTKDRSSSSPVVASISPLYQHTYHNSVPLTLFAVVKLSVNSEAAKGFPPVSGDYYYGFLLFRQGGSIFVLQHRQPYYQVDKMERVLKAMLDAMSSPAEKRTKHRVKGKGCPF